MESVQLYAEMALYSTLDLFDRGARLYGRNAPKCLLECSFLPAPAKRHLEKVPPPRLPGGFSIAVREKSLTQMGKIPLGGSQSCQSGGRQSQ